MLEVDRGSPLAPINENLGYLSNGEDRLVVCRHCRYQLARPGEDWRDRLAVCTSEVSVAGPHIAVEAEQYIEEEVVFRQLCCPGCFTAFVSEVVPVGA